MSRSFARQGFTLIEMSIVLLLIALIVGGIIGGQELVNAARLQRIGKDAIEIRDAVMTFQSKYGDLPGDISNATQLWGNTGCNNGIAKNTCDGDGDGRLRSSAASTAAGDSSLVTEMVRLWQHLNLSNMYPGNFSGLVGSPNLYLPNVNAPSGPLGGSVYLVGWTVVFGTSSDIGQYTQINNFIRFESAANITSGDMAGGILTSTEAKAIDDKIDDGISYMGRVIGMSMADNMGCSFYGTKTPLDYNLSIKTRQCVLRLNFIDTGQKAY